MCGIFGYISSDKRIINQFHRQKDGILNSLKSRGRDLNGYFHSDNIGFYHSRLSIVDTSDNGLQPMSDNSGRYTLTFNGELYNHKELRSSLEKRYKFKSQTDSEVLLYGFIEWGVENLLKKARGMFAFAVADSVKKCVTISRDRFGKKPLFFYKANTFFLFSSNLQAIYKCCPQDCSFDQQQIFNYFANLYSPSPNSIFKNVKKLGPGTYAKISFSNDLHFRSYADPVLVEDIYYDNIDDVLEEVDNLLKVSVARRLAADVPVGILLSGGVDSGIIAGLAKRQISNIKTFSVCVDESDLDESKYCNLTANKLNTDHTTIKVDKLSINDIDELIKTMCEPLGDSSALNFYSICKEASKYVKVVLTGDGGDEIFAGYRDTYLNYKITPLREMTQGMGLKFSNRLEYHGRRKWINKFFTLFNMLCTEKFSNAKYFNQITNKQIIKNIFQSSWVEGIEVSGSVKHYDDVLTKYNTLKGSKYLLNMKLKTQFVDDYLMKVDNASMAAGVEARSPFLDQDVFSLVSRLNMGNLLFKNKGKGLLKKYSERFIPHECIYRKKQGFAAPLTSIINSNHSIRDCLLDKSSLVSDFINPTRLFKEIDYSNNNLLKNRLKHFVWAAFILEKWIKLLKT